MRRGFTLIEILIMVAIIGVLMAAAVVNVASGREAAHAKAAARGVAQMCHYANALALLRQRPVVLTYFGGKIEVQMSGDAPQSVSGKNAAPIYMNDVNGTPAAMNETDDEPHDAPSGKGAGGGEPDAAEKAGMFFTRRILDPEELAKEDAERSFEGVVFDAEVTGDEGEEIDDRTRQSLESQADALVAGRAKIRAWSNTSGDINTDGKDKDKDEEDGDATEMKKPARVVFETNGNCSPHRVTVKNAAEGKEDEVLMVIEVARTGKVTICDEDDVAPRNSKGWRKK